MIPPDSVLPTSHTLLFTWLIPLLLSVVLLAHLSKAFAWRLITGRRPDASRGCSLPPGNNGLPLIGETLSFLAANSSSRGFYEFVRCRRLRYGNCFRTNIFGKTHVFVCSTDAAKAVLGGDSVNFTKRYIRSIAELLGEQSLLCATMENHRHLRRRMSDLFNAESQASAVRAFDELTVEMLRRWKPGETVVVFEEALKITFKAMCKMLVSSAGEVELEELQKDVFEVTQAMLAFPWRLPGSRFLRGLKARKRIMCMLKRLILRAKGEGPTLHRQHGGGDFLQSLVASELVDGDGPSSPDSEQMIQDNILTLIIAGQITTASAITWMVKYLDENQHVQHQLRELHLGLACSSTQLGPEVLRDMTFASKVVKEVLRMATIVSWFPRIALRDCDIQGFQIREGWIVNVDAKYIHADSNLYKDPAKFDPCRFDEGEGPTRAPAYSFLAFGTGERTCLGMNLAKAMMVVFLHRLITTFRWKVMDPNMSLEKHALFPRLRSGCPIAVTPLHQ